MWCIYESAVDPRRSRNLILLLRLQDAEGLPEDIKLAFCEWCLGQKWPLFRQRYLMVLPWSFGYFRSLLGVRLCDLTLELWMIDYITANVFACLDIHIALLSH